MLNIRDARPSDENSLYRISLATGHAGQDATTGIFADQKLMGHIHSATYLGLSPDLSFVAERNDQVLGLCVSVENTLAFADRLEPDC